MVKWLVIKIIAIVKAVYEEPLFRVKYRELKTLNSELLHEKEILKIQCKSLEEQLAIERHFHDISRKVNDGLFNLLKHHKEEAGVEKPVPKTWKQLLKNPEDNPPFFNDEQMKQIMTSLQSFRDRECTNTEFVL